MAAPLVHWRETVHYLARVFLLLLAILVFMTVLGGCGYAVHLRSVQIEDQPAVPDGTRIWVGRSPEIAVADEYDEVLKHKLEVLLRANGYAVAEQEEADHFLFFDHKVESLMSRISLELTSGVRGGMGTYRREGPFDRSIFLRVVSAEAYRAGTDDTLWASTAAIWAAPNESPKFDDLLLLATFKHFPDDTGEPVIERMNLESAAARRLR